MGDRAVSAKSKTNTDRTDAHGSSRINLKKVTIWGPHFLGIPLRDRVGYDNWVMRRSRLLILVLAAILIVVASVRWYERQAQRKRDARYQASLRQYSEQFRPGSSRKIVEDYFRAKGIPVWQEFGPGSLDALSDLILIGKDAGPWYCSNWNVYVAFDFAALEKHAEFELAPLNSDSLRKIHVRHMGEGCL